MFGAEFCVLTKDRMNLPLLIGVRHLNGFQDSWREPERAIPLLCKSWISLRATNHDRFELLGTVGLIVDEVTEVVSVPRDEIRPAPDLLGGDKAPFFLGVCQYRGRTLTLLNVKRLLASDEPVFPDRLEQAAEESPDGRI